MQCHTELGFTREVTIKLRNFGIKQQELARALLEAKPLGICKITTSEEAKQNSRDLDLIKRSGNVSMKIDIILTNEESKGTLF